jgi:uncharacterized membrane protein
MPLAAVAGMATGQSATPNGTAASTDLKDVTAKNVASVLQLEAADHERRSTSDRAADAITGFSGSMAFIWTHVVWFTAWIGGNVLTGRDAIDPFPFPLLTLVVSLEAIFLATFILISENRQARIADRRNLLDLQIDLLAEQENTKMLMLLRQIAERVGVPLEDHEVAALEKETDCAELTEQIDEQMAAVERKEAAPAAAQSSARSLGGR